MCPTCEDDVIQDYAMAVAHNHLTYGYAKQQLSHTYGVHAAEVLLDRQLKYMGYTGHLVAAVTEPVPEPEPAPGEPKTDDEEPNEEESGDEASKVASLYTRAFTVHPSANRPRGRIRDLVGV